MIQKWIIVTISIRRKKLGFSPVVRHLKWISFDLVERFKMHRMNSTNLWNKFRVRVVAEAETGAEFRTKETRGSQLSNKCWLYFNLWAQHMDISHLSDAIRMDFESSVSCSKAQRMKEWAVNSHGNKHCHCVGRQTTSSLSSDDPDMGEHLKRVTTSG